MTRWYREKKREHYYKQAKQQGYRARSAYKLKEIQYKFSLMKPGDHVIDLGGAPGGWSQIASEIVGSTGKVIAVDLQEMKPLQGVIIIQGDMTQEQTLQEIQQLMQQHKADVVLSDMSPDISGNYSIDQARSVWLCEHALSVAQALLKDKGHFVCKIFEGEDMAVFLEQLRQSFYIVKQFNPKASRKSSSEVYLVAMSFHG